MKKFLAVIALSVSMIGLSACGAEAAPTQDQLFTVYNVNVNGQSVPCIIYDDAARGAELSCNWSVYK